VSLQPGLNFFDLCVKRATALKFFERLLVPERASFLRHVDWLFMKNVRIKYLTKYFASALT